MPVHQTFRQYTQDGRPFIEFRTWLGSLPTEQQPAYEQALSRQQAHRQDAIDQGLLTLLPDQSYVWKDLDTMKKGKLQDEIWSQFHDRWAKENAIVSQDSTQEI